MSAVEVKVLESDVSSAVKMYMELRGWHMLRCQSVVWTSPSGGVHRAGEKGIPDFLALRYQPDHILWIEMKRPGDRRTCPRWCRNRLASSLAQGNSSAREIATQIRAGRRAKVCTVCSQREWREAEEKRGATVITVQSFEEFEPFYEERYGFLHPPNGTPVRLPLGALR